MNYYELLGVGKDSSTDDIDKAYRQKALELHPDRNPDKDATEKFKRVTEAYEVLKDPLKKSEYDLYGKVGSRGPSVGRYAYDDMMAHMFGFGRNVRRKQGRDLKVDVSIELAEVITGCTKDVTITHQEKCSTCQGQGAVDWKLCNICNGMGRRVLNQNPFVIETQCGACHGKGKFPGRECGDCGGNGWKGTRQETLSVRIPAGVVDGMHLRLEGQGDEENGDKGDLYVMVIVKPHDFFVRHGNTDMFCSIPLTFSELMFGVELEIPSLDGNKIKLAVPPKTHPKSRLRLMGQGLPSLGESGRGNLYAVIDLDIPECNNVEYRNKIAELSDLEKLNYGTARKTFNNLL